MNWRDYWNRDTPIYVNDRHKTLHYRIVAGDIAALILSRAATVLDYGCGEALFADRVAQHCRKLFLCDAAPLVRERLEKRFRTEPRIAVIAPEHIEEMEAASLDLVVANSVLQYLSLDEFRNLLGLWRAKLKPDGRLVLADVIPHEVSPLDDGRALLSFAWKGGFLRAAVIGLARTALSDYRTIRDELGLSQYDEGELVDLLRDNGFAAERQTHNIGHNQARMTLVAQPT